MAQVRDIILVVHVDGRIIDVNQAALKAYGYSIEEFGSLRVHNLRAPETQVAIDTQLKTAQQNGSLFRSMHLRRNGERFPVEVSSQRIYLTDEEVIVSIVRDITESVAMEMSFRESEAKFRRMAYYDSLTGLPNRRCLQERLVKELEKARRGEATGAILFVDIDNLKMINDTLGHSHGDNIIVKAGSCILAEAGEHSTVARIGGDEFIVLLPNEGNQKKVAFVADSMVKSFRKNYVIGDSSIPMTASIGIALYPLHGDTVEAVFKNSDLALYAAKGSGKNNWCFYEASLDKVACSCGDSQNP